MLDRIADYLFEHETITGKEFMRIYREIKGIPQPPDEEEKPPVQMQGFRQANQPGAGANPGAGQGSYAGTDADSRNPGRQNAVPNGQNYRMPNMQNPVNQDYMTPNGQNQTMPSRRNPMSENQTMPNMQHPSGQNQGVLNGQNTISQNQTMPMMQNALGQNQAVPNGQNPMGQNAMPEIYPQNSGGHSAGAGPHTQGRNPAGDPVRMQQNPLSEQNRMQKNMAADQNASISMNSMNSMQVPGNGQHVGMGQNMQEQTLLGNFDLSAELSGRRSQGETAGSGSSAQHLQEDGQRSSQEDQQRKQ